RAGDTLARGALRLREGSRRRLQRRPPRAAHGSPHHLSPVAPQGGSDRTCHAREGVRAARTGRAGRRLCPARQRAGVGALQGRSAPRRHLHRPPHPAHARGLLRAARVRRQPPPARLDDARPRGRRPAARLLDLLAREGRLQRAPRPSHVDAEPGRAERTATDQRRRQPGPGHDNRVHPHLRDRLSVARRKPEDEVLGNHGLARFDFCIIGSGAGGGTAAHVLTAGGKNVLVLEAGPNPFPGLDDPSGLPLPLHSNDELKYSIRSFVQQDPFLEPRTYADLEPFYVEAERLYGVQGKEGDNIFESARSQPYPMPPGVPMYFALLLADGARQVTLPGFGALNPHPYPAAINSRFYDER